MTKKNKGQVGSSFDDFLKEQGTREATTERAIKRVLAYQLMAEMEAQKITKDALAARMQTSRSQLDRVLDPDHEGITLGALRRAAEAVGRKLTIELR